MVSRVHKGGTMVGVLWQTAVEYAQLAHAAASCPPFRLRTVDPSWYFDRPAHLHGNTEVFTGCAAQARRRGGGLQHCVPVWPFGTQQAMNNRWRVRRLYGEAELSLGLLGEPALRILIHDGVIWNNSSFGVGSSRCSRCSRSSRTSNRRSDDIAIA